MNNTAVLLGTSEHKKNPTHEVRGEASGFSTWAEKEWPKGKEFHPNYLPAGETMTFEQPCSIHIGYLDQIGTRNGTEDKTTIIQMDMEPHGKITGPLLWEHAGQVGQKSATPKPVPVSAWMCTFLVPFFAAQYKYLFLPYPTTLIGFVWILALAYALFVSFYIGGRYVHFYELKKSLRLDKLKFISPAEEP